MHLYNLFYYRASYTAVQKKEDHTSRKKINQKMVVIMELYSCLAVSYSSRISNGS